MKLSVNFEDSVVVCNGLGFSAKNRLQSPDANYRALQWMGENGWIEVYHGERIWLTSEADVQPYVDLHAQLGNEAIEKALAEAAAEDAAEVTPEGNPPI